MSLTSPGVSTSLTYTIHITQETPLSFKSSNMGLPSWLVWYKKPEYRDIREYSAAVGSGKRALSPDGRNKTAIPSRLSLQRVLDNKTCTCRLSPYGHALPL